MRRIPASWLAFSALCAGFAALILAAGLPLVIEALRPIGVRIASVLIVAAVWGLLAWLHMRQVRQATEAIAAELAGAGVARDGSSATAARMADAVAAAQSMAGKRRGDWRATPWYLVMGPPGAGKTTALSNAGLHFVAGDPALSTGAATRDVDFRIADEAVMIDTAGHCMKPGSGAMAEGEGWTGLLSALAKHRPLAPINGIIVAIGADELARGDHAAIDDHARMMRDRLVELRRTLRVAVPVYVVLTKADLVAGFTEYHADLDEDRRRAVFGATLPWGDAPPSRTAIGTAFDAVAQAVTDRQAKRLLDEPDPQRRSLLLGFPSQVAALRAPLMRFLDDVFGTGGEPGGMLRGFYLTSAIQTGTPFDAVLSRMAEVHDRPPRAQGAYFLDRLLSEVVLPEAGLVAVEPGERKTARSVGALAGIAVAAIVVLGAWGVSFVRNRAFANDLSARADAVQRTSKQAGIDLATVRGSDPDLRAALPVLDALRDLPRGFAASVRGGPPLSMRFGLYQTGLARDAEDSYRGALRRIMLPRLLLRLEQLMQASAADPAKARQALQVYLMLGGRRPLDKTAVTSFIAADWANNLYPGPNAASERADLGTHLAALLDDPDMVRVWPEGRAPLDAATIAEVSGAPAAASPVPPPAVAPNAAIPAGGPIGPLYTQTVLPACRAVAQGRYPFFGGAAQDVPIADVLQLFGPGGVMDVFVRQRATGLMDTSGPIWRWRSDDPAAAAFDPQSPEEFSKAVQIRDLLVGGLALKVQVAALGSDVTAVEIASGGAVDSFARAGNETKPLVWTAHGAPTADVVLRGAGGVELARYKADGPWALFRLMDQANRENAGKQAFKATFGDAARSVTFQIALPSERNPFSRGGVWSFRCPTAL